MVMFLSPLSCSKCTLCVLIQNRYIRISITHVIKPRECDNASTIWSVTNVPDSGQLVVQTSLIQVTQHKLISTSRHRPEMRTRPCNTVPFKDQRTSSALGHADQTTYVWGHEDSRKTDHCRPVTFTRPYWIVNTTQVCLTCRTVALMSRPCKARSCSFRNTR